MITQEDVNMVNDGLTTRLCEAIGNLPKMITLAYSIEQSQREREQARDRAISDAEAAADRLASFKTAIAGVEPLHASLTADVKTMSEQRDSLKAEVASLTEQVGRLRAEYRDLSEKHADASAKVEALKKVLA